jgi:hypothetical protein
MEMETGPDGSVMRDNLRDAALTLVRLGFLREAQSIADQIDALQYGGGWSHDIYMALLAKDPSLAPSLLAGIRSAFIQIEVSVIWAQSPFASGDAAKAQSVLQSLATDHAARMDEEYSVPEYRTKALSRIAKAQASLAFTDDAAATRTMGLSFVSASKRPHQRISALLSLAESFP